MKYLSAVLAVILSALCLSVRADCPETAIPNLVKWSEWSGAPTAAGATVTIGAGDNILLDVSPPTIQKLTIYGNLIVDPNASGLTLGAYFIYVRSGGHFYAGSSDCPYTNPFNIVLFGNKQLGVNPDSVGTKVFGVFAGGQVDIHGAARKATWTMLDDTVAIGATTLTVADEIDWVVGEKLVLAGTDLYNSNEYLENYVTLPSQSEVVNITAVSGKTVTFAPAAKYVHWGKKWASGSDEIDTRGEVGLLSRNIIVRGDTSGTAAADSWGGHIMIRDGGKGRLSYIEVTAAGQLGELGRYPIHFHNASVQPESYITGCSIHDTFQRSITVHATFNLTLRDNVAFRSRGHMYFIEDGNEENNVFDHNLAINPLPIPQGILLLSDNEPACFWITNPNNHFYSNAAVEGKEGFWYSMPDWPTQLAAADIDNVLRLKPNGDFINNRAHGNYDGLFIDRGEGRDGSVDGLTSYYPTDFTKFYEIIARLKASGDDTSFFTRMSAYGEYERFSWGTPAPATFIGFTSFKNIDHGMWGRGSGMWSYGAKFADNTIGCVWPGSDNLMQNAVFVGETDNKGTPYTGPGVWWLDEEGRTRPFKYNRNASIVGYSSYDAAGGDIGIDIRFYNYNNYVFQNGDIRRSGALSGITGPNVIEPTNRLYGLSFTSVDNRVLFRGYEDKWDGDDVSTNNGLNSQLDDAVKAIVWVDADGSILKGTPYESMGCGARIVGTSPHVRTTGCTAVPQWSAWVCPAAGVAYRAFYFSDNTNAVSDTKPTYLQARTESDLHLTRTSDKAAVDVEGDFQYGQFGNGAYSASYSYGTTIMMNQDYFINVATGRQSLANFRLSVSGVAPGEFVRFAVPYAAGSTFEVTKGWDSSAATQVSSKSALAKDTYFWESSTNLLWLYVAVDEQDVDYSYAYNIPSASVTVIFNVKLQGASTSLVSYPTSVTVPNGAAATGPNVNYCTVGGGDLGKLSEYSASTAEEVIFGDTLGASWDIPTWSNPKPQITNTTKSAGTSGLYFFMPKPWQTYMLHRDGAFPGSYTHMRMSVRAAPGQGPIKLSIQYRSCDEPQETIKSVMIHAPQYTANAGPISDAAWSVVTVPLSELNTLTDPTCVFLSIQPRQGKPMEFYIDELKLVSVTATSKAVDVFPNRPLQPPVKGPGSNQPLPVIGGGGGGLTPGGVKPTDAPAEVDAIKGDMSMVFPSVVLCLFALVCALF